jgi:hypothetical protein
MDRVALGGGAGAALPRATFTAGEAKQVVGYPMARLIINAGPVTRDHTRGVGLVGDSSQQPDRVLVRASFTGLGKRRTGGGLMRTEMRPRRRHFHETPAGCGGRIASPLYRSDARNSGLAPASFTEPAGRDPGLLLRRRATGLKRNVDEKREN